MAIMIDCLSVHHYTVVISTILMFCVVL